MTSLNTHNGDPVHRRDGQPKYKTYTRRNFRKLPQMQRFSEDELFAMEVVANVLPFKCNNYVIDELIDWNRVPDDPMFQLTFPQRDMLRQHHFEKMARELKNDLSKDRVRVVADEIRRELNPNPAGQMDKNLPTVDGVKVQGMQHKYRETLLFFPSQGQTCHAYCTFCFRWPQFTGIDDLKFASMQADLMVSYLKQHPEITDVLFTGGDPLVMRTKMLAPYIEALLQADLPHLRSIRIGTKALAYWPYKFVTEPDAGDTLRLFEKVSESGRHLAFMAHYSHPREMETKINREAVRRIQDTGAQIRTQSPLLHHINNDAQTWATMWQMQVEQGMVPYYMFVARDTGARHYFEVPLAQAWKVFKGAYEQVSGLARTVRGPSMSTDPGKVQVLGVSEIKGEKVFILRFLQGRNPQWVHQPFYAQYDPQAVWLSDLKPAFGETAFFFEKESNLTCSHEGHIAPY